jgi:diaminohydroxyphosphoribosylaminopyrimidine deaminase/5-amino-6-(5-phosphoribosylamino)uracil reductase|tara:strand:- start:2406 stop:3572 length:1167 start_codon:yes stop_codon:yes gene_type:complete
MKTMKKISNDKLQPEILDWPVYMRRAIDLAGNAINTSPNPRVGCVLVINQEIVGEGWHVALGEAHAEVMALEQAGDRAKSSIAFVSLEPCSHTGRTGPCSDALIKAGVSQVVIACIDPNVEVAGKGVEKLIAAGIPVTQLTDFDSLARAVTPGYFKRREQGIPYVRCKLAMSLDGRTALANGESKWISGQQSRSDVQRLRAESSAVITGIETVLADDPSLNVRIGDLNLAQEDLARNEKALSKQPLRVILDSHLRTPTEAKILSLPGEVKVFSIDTPGTAKNLASNVEYVQAAASGKRVSLHSVLESLASDFACTEVLVEAGATLSTAFIKAGLVDELIVYIAPKLLGSDARSLLNIAGIESMSDSLNFEITDLQQIDCDIRVVLKPV